MSRPPLSDSPATTLVAGLLLAASGLIGVVAALAPWSPLPLAVPALVVPALALLGVLALVVGPGREAGLWRASRGASVGLLAWAAADMVSRVASSAVVDADPAAWRVVAVVLLVPRLVGLACGVAGTVVVVRGRLLEPWARRALVAVLATRVAFAVFGVVPSLDLQLAVATARLGVAVPLTVLALGVALVLHGRTGAALAGGVRHVDERWRATTDVVPRGRRGDDAR